MNKVEGLQKWNEALASFQHAEKLIDTDPDKAKILAWSAVLIGYWSIEAIGGENLADGVLNSYAEECPVPNELFDILLQKKIEFSEKPGHVSVHNYVNKARKALVNMKNLVPIELPVP